MPAVGAVPASNSQHLVQNRLESCAVCQCYAFLTHRSFIFIVMSWLEDSQVLSKWKAVTLTETGVPAKPFLTAAKAIISLFDLIAGMGMVKGDMVGNAETLEKLVGDSDTTLQADRAAHASPSNPSCALNATLVVDETTGQMLLTFLLRPFRTS
eukprot:6196115-Pleurochrysis_carterae.AAC.2